MQLNDNQKIILRYLSIGFVTVEDAHRQAIAKGADSGDLCWDMSELWVEGYFDRLSAHPILLMFPCLRSRKYRSDMPKDDQYVTLTAKGYFAVNPVITWREV